MKLNTPKVREYLKECSLERLFIEELGWDRYTSTLSFEIGEYTYALEALAEKRGVQIIQCKPDSDGNVPDYNTRRKIEKQVTRSAYEHLIIFVNHENTVQIWQWVARQPGKPAAYREHTYNPQRQSGDALIQKLEAITIPLDEEETLDLTGTVYRLRDAFDRDRVTKRFYDGFKKEHGVFLELIQGITDNEDVEWYASLMLNRLMFVYFIQRKGFLDGDQHYLRNRLEAVQGRKGKGKFYTFYRYFLLTLFHEGFSKRPKGREIDKELLDLLGNIPFLNGGLFEVHELEYRYPKLDIPDEAFTRLFDFFEQYEWHLDTRPLQNDREINPDVLGYIFEKYINQKQMGAYYSKEDITGYISQNTVIPYLFDATRDKYPNAFEGKANIWTQLEENPERYTYEAVKHGVDVELPRDIAIGIKDVDKRGKWSETAPPEYGLPTETWRETIGRRISYQRLISALEDGEVDQVDDLITYNLNIRQLAQDVIENCDDPDLLRFIFEAIQTVTVLDPACGSGAFLFAAMNILEVLYDACIERMQAYVDEGNTRNEYEDFEAVLRQLGEHPSREYFIFKSIIVNNLFGVDLMEEAVEICKLRLFLKLVSQIERVEDIEPLPDIDFNIKAGNSLVGYANESELEKSTQISLGSNDWLDAIKKEAEILRDEFAVFREMQVQAGGAPDPVTKKRIQDLFSSLNLKLDAHLAVEYGIDPNDEVSFEGWQLSHRPFHWGTNFYEIMQDGGFNVIIGNPPYVEYTKVRSEYTIRNYDTEECGNLYAYFVERNFNLLNNSSRTGMIIAHSSICTDRMSSLIEELTSRSKYAWFSSFAIRPSKLFVGVEQRLVIYLIEEGTQDQGTYTSSYHRWLEDFRPYLFESIKYVEISSPLVPNSIDKIASSLEVTLLNKLKKYSRFDVARTGSETVHYHNAPRYWIRAMDFIPFFWNERDGEHISSQNKTIVFPSKDDAMAAVTVLNSSLFYWWFIAFSDCRHLNVREIDNFPIGLKEMKKPIKKQLRLLAEELMKDLKRNAKRKECTYKTTGQVKYDEFFPKFSKPIVDRIDEVLAEHYGFSDEELDFVINYDIKYRMGLD